MRYIVVFIVVVCLNAGEFDFVKPISVEKAPKIVKAPKPKKVQKKSQQPKQSKKIKHQDSDNDGVFDKDDKCPNTDKNFIVDKYGCPKTATLDITFAPYKAELPSKSNKDIKNFASFLKQNKDYQVVIYGYTDSLGDADANKILSQKRALAVQYALEKDGVKSTRLTSVGMGEENPIADNSTKEGRAKNRRIEVELIY